MSERLYDVLSRPAGGVQAAFAMCSDGLGHIFGYVPDRGKADDVPACGQNVTARRPLTDDEPMCVTCSVAGESWAQGGALKVEGSA